MSTIDLGSFSFVMQYGFAGFSVLLLGVLVWMVAKFIQSQKETIRVLEKLGASIDKNDTTNQSIKLEVTEMHRKLNSRPCIAKHE